MTPLQQNILKSRFVLRFDPIVEKGQCSHLLTGVWETAHGFAAVARWPWPWRPCLGLHRTGIGTGVLHRRGALCTRGVPFPAVTSSKRNFRHFFTSPNHLCSGINKNNKEFGESSFGIYCI